ncbi:MAG: NAD(P)/FAD-dependent oxidoreductase [Candidatus Bipolaricaulaceae bacterium]
MIREVEVAVVGGGAAGMAAAKAAADAGAKTLLIERNPSLGGVLDQCIHPGFGLHRYRQELTGPEFAQRLIAELEASPAEILLEATVLEVTSERELRVVSPKGIWRIRTKALVWAAGARERPLGALLIPGSRPAGIFTAGLAQRLVNIHGLLPGKRALILGSGDIGLIMARRLFLEGMEVVGVVEIKPFPGGLLRNVVQCLEDFGIPLFLRHTVAEVHGRTRLTGVTLMEVDEQGRPLPGTEKLVEVDTLILSVGLVPELRPLGSVLSPEARDRPLVVNHLFQTTPPWIFAAGNALAIFDLVDTVAGVGEEAGRNAALWVKDALPPVRMASVQAGANVAMVLPQKIAPGQEARLYLRVTGPLSPAVVRVGQAFSQNHVAVRPAEMVEVVLPPEATEDLASASEIVVEVVPA